MSFAKLNAQPERIVRHSDKEMCGLRDESNWKRAEAATQEQIERAIASDPDEADLLVDWSAAWAGNAVPQDEA
ncbi:hypothetical protein [Methylosinus sp. Ce-a6]|uniref:hypothetical protein n=1 Tax=Methylosinus sp. Ce-a6 TaxID=2172005 RepID=UPI00135CF62C|nr:hypothetical protein [Methylosinus sp. Ce-a6]